MVTYSEKHSYIRGSLEIDNSEERLFIIIKDNKKNPQRLHAMPFY